MSQLSEIIRKAEDNYLNGTVRLGEFVDFSMYNTVETTTAYLNSKHISGLTDSLGREKPFFNIVSSTVNIWYRATDIDRKDIVVLPSKSHDVVGALLATILLQDWMKKVNFNTFLNQWGRALAQYGSAIVKFVEKDDELVPIVIPWSKFIPDPIDFGAIPRIEKFYKTPEQLSNMANSSHPDYAGYDEKAVNDLIAMRESNTRRNQRQEQVDNLGSFIEIYEVHGNLPLSLLTDNDKDEKTFRQQMHAICFQADKKGKEHDFTLFKGKEKEDPYMLTHLIKEEGRTLSIGAVEYLFDAQWMVNHSLKQWKDQMDIMSKIVFQTSDPNFVGRNVLTGIENGEIFTHSVNHPITKVDNSSQGTGVAQGFANQWLTLARELTSTPDAVRGGNQPANTPYSLVAYSGTQALSLFELMVENKANDLEMMMRTKIIPHLLKKLDNKDEILAMLEDRDIKKIDSMYVPTKAIKAYNDRAINNALNDKKTEPFDQQTEEANITKDLSVLGNQRAISPGEVTWKEVLDGLEWKLDVQLTNEQMDKQAVLTTLSTLFQTIASNPNALVDKNNQLLFNRILSVSNVISPAEISPVTSPPSPDNNGQPNNLDKLQELAKK